MPNKLLLLALWLAVHHPMTAQMQQDSFDLVGPEVVVSAIAISSHSQLQLDSAQSLPQALSELASMQVQQVTPGGLTTSISGASAARHLALTWQGWNIQSPLNGTFDLALVNLAVFDDSRYIDRVQLQGTGSAGHRGVIELGSDGHRGQVAYRYDTWNDHHLSAKKALPLAGGQLHLSTALRQRDLAYRYDRFGQVQRQEQADQSAGDLQLTYLKQLSPSISLEVGSWLQYSDRELAPSKTAASAMEQQTDDNRRFFVSSKYQEGNHHLTLKAAYFDEYIHYRSRIIDSKASNYASMVSGTYTYGKKYPTTVEVLSRNDIVRSSFEINQQRNTTQLLIAQSYPITDQLQSSLSLRQDLIDGKAQPVILSGRLQYSLSTCNVEAQYTRSYTAPTLNDLYWPQLGNADLVAEQGHLASLQLSSWDLAKDLQVSITGHYQVVDNWILWAPGIDGIWRPSNTQTVKNASVLIDATWSSRLTPKQLLTLAANINYGPTRARQTHVDAYRQLIYTPRLRATGSIQYQAHRLNTRLAARHTGKRYQDPQNTASLDPFTIFDIRLQYILPSNTTFGLEINNVLDERYELVPFFPTSLRHFSFSISKSL